MENKDLNIVYTVDHSPTEVFNAINNVRGWWSDTLEGATQHVNDEFTYRYKDLHYSRQRVIESVPGKKVVWLVTDSNLSFLTKTDEWTGTTVEFKINKVGDKTQLNFTHRGLTPGVECFEACTKGWTAYADRSLRSLITTGKGQPN